MRGTQNKIYWRGWRPLHFRHLSGFFFSGVGGRESGTMSSTFRILNANTHVENDMMHIIFASLGSSNYWRRSFFSRGWKLSLTAAKTELEIFVAKKSQFEGTLRSPSGPHPRQIQTAESLARPHRKTCTGFYTFFSHTLRLYQNLFISSSPLPSFFPLLSLHHLLSSVFLLCIYMYLTLSTLSFPHSPLSRLWTHYLYLKNLPSSSYFACEFVSVSRADPYSFLSPYFYRSLSLSGRQ